MTKTATVQARIEPELKKNVDAILASLGMSASEAISMYYSQIEMHQGLPFKVRVLKKSVQKAIRDAEMGRNLYKVKDPANFIEELLGKR